MLGWYRSWADTDAGLVQMLGALTANPLCQTNNRSALPLPSSQLRGFLLTAAEAPVLKFELFLQLKSKVDVLLYSLGMCIARAALTIHFLIARLCRTNLDSI